MVPEPIAAPAPSAPVDRLLPVRFSSDDPELALFAARIVDRTTALEACADAELATLGTAGFVRVTIDEPVPRSARGELAIVPRVTGIGSTALHECVRDALASVQLPALLGTTRRKRIAFTVDLRIGPIDPTLEALPDHGDELVVDDTGGCTWLHESPCAPHKSCMGPERRATRCPIAWGPPPRDISSRVANRILYYTRPCLALADRGCTIVFERSGDACDARMRDDEAETAGRIAMACADFERLWALTRSKGLPRAATDGARPVAEVSIGANRIEPGWSASRVKRWQWTIAAGPPVALGTFETALIEQAAALGLPLVQQYGSEATPPPH